MQICMCVHVGGVFMCGVYVWCVCVCVCVYEGGVYVCVCGVVYMCVAGEGRGHCESAYQKLCPAQTCHLNSCKSVCSLAGISYNIMKTKYVCGRKGDVS